MLTDIQKQTIILYCRYNMNAAKVAEKMDVVQSTVTHRFESIRRKTGLDPRRFYDLVKLRRMVQNG